MFDVRRRNLIAIITIVFSVTCYGYNETIDKTWVACGSHYNEKCRYLSLTYKV